MKRHFWGVESLLIFCQRHVALLVPNLILTYYDVHTQSVSGDMFFCPYQDLLSRETADTFTFFSPIITLRHP